MDEIVSVSVYKEISALMGDKEVKKKDIFDPDHVRTPLTSICQVVGFSYSMLLLFLYQWIHILIEGAE